eukprot:4238410-Pyramimonas_sp.AAC.1
MDLEGVVKSSWPEFPSSSVAIWAQPALSLQPPFTTQHTVLRMASIARVISEIQGSAGVVEARSKVAHDQADLDRLSESLTASLCAMVRNINEHVMSESASAMMNAVGASRFSDSQKAVMMASIQDKLMNGSRSAQLAGHDKQAFATPT